MLYAGWYFDPNLWVVFLILTLILDRIISCFRSKYGTHHHAKAGLSAMPRALANSAVLHGCDSFMSFKGIQDSNSSAHFTSKDHPTLVFLGLFWPRCLATYFVSRPNSNGLILSMINYGIYHRKRVPMRVHLGYHVFRYHDGCRLF
jgi:hypothetical protein